MFVSTSCRRFSIASIEGTAGRGKSATKLRNTDKLTLQILDPIYANKFTVTHDGFSIQVLPIVDALFAHRYAELFEVIALLRDLTTSFE